MSGHSCLTRIVTGDDCAVEIAHLQSVMLRIQRALNEVPALQREYIANALLNLAVTRMVQEEGSTQTVGILCRLRDAVAHGAPPPPERAVDLTRTDA